MKKITLLVCILFMTQFLFGADEDAKRDGNYFPTQLQVGTTSQEIRRVKCDEDGIQLFKIVSGTSAITLSPSQISDLKKVEISSPIPMGANLIGQVSDDRYALKLATATFRAFFSSVTISLTYPVSEISVVPIGGTVTVSSNLGDINDIVLLDRIGVSLPTDRPKTGMTVILANITEGATVYFTAK